MEFLPPEDFDEIYFDMQNVYVEDSPSYPPKISLSMIKEEENVITVIISHNHPPTNNAKRVTTRNNTITNIKYVQCK